MFGSMGYADYPNSKSNIPAILDEIFAPFTEVLGEATKTYADSLSSDSAAYILAFEIPRLVKNSITVTVEPTKSQYRTLAHKVVIKAIQTPLQDYVKPNENKQQTVSKSFILYGQDIALDGSLSLSYNEGVLVITIPLTKPVEPKKATLSARLADIES